MAICFAHRVLVAASLFGATLVLSPPTAHAGPPQTTPAGDFSAPANIDIRTKDVWRTLDRAAWISRRAPNVEPNGRILYVVTFRSCPTCAAFKAAEYDGLLKAGVEVRWIMFARRDKPDRVRSKPGERAMIAALWGTRDPDLLDRWWDADDLDAFYAGGGMPPLADGNPAAEGRVAQSRDFVDRMAGLLADNGIDMAIPALIWREGRETKVFIGYDAAGFAPARSFITGRF